MALDSTQLTARLRLDFRAGDVGDTDIAFETRLATAVNGAFSRRTVYPLLMDAQIEAGARWTLLSAQMRELIRSYDMTQVDDVREQRDAASRFAELRRELQILRLASGLDSSTLITRARTVVATTQVEF